MISITGNIIVYFFLFLNPQNGIFLQKEELYENRRNHL